MHKYHSIHLRKNNKEWQPLNFSQLSELEAQESLFEISKLDEIHEENQNFLKQLSKTQRPLKKSMPKEPSPTTKKQQIKELRQSISANIRPLNEVPARGRPLGLTSFVVIDNRKHQRELSEMGHKTERSRSQSLHEQVNRKAKYLFRLRNRSKAPIFTIKKGLKLKDTLNYSQITSQMLDKI